jgi:hypothetical protein
LGILIGFIVLVEDAEDSGDVGLLLLHVSSTVEFSIR